MILIKTQISFASQQYLKLDMISYSGTFIAHTMQFVKQITIEEMYNGTVSPWTVSACSLFADELKNTFIVERISMYKFVFKHPHVKMLNGSR